MVWQDGQGFGRIKIRKLVARRSRKEVCRQTFLNGSQRILTFMQFGWLLHRD